MEKLITDHFDPFWDEKICFNIIRDHKDTIILTFIRSINPVFKTMRIPSTQPIFDRETVFQLVGQKKWLDIIELFKDNRRGEAVLSDPILKNFID